MDITKLSKQELFIKCEEVGIKKCKSKKKDDLINLLKTKLIIKEDKQEDKQENIKEDKQENIQEDNQEIKNEVINLTSSNPEIYMDIYDYLNKTKRNQTMTEEEFIKILPRLIDNLFQYGFTQIINDYNDGYLSDITTDWENLKSYKIETNNINAQCTIGLSIIKKHMSHIYDVQNYKGKSISLLWTKDNIEKALKINRQSHSTPYVSEIIRQIGFIAGTSKVTIYRPLLTKRIVEYFDAKEVLDVCVGWGGRMLGSACIDGVNYTGIEPCNKTYNSLQEIKDKLGLDRVSLYKDVAENVLPTLERKYDLAITSPPYYNLEIYSNEETQSHQYGCYKNWYDLFLKPVVHGVLNKLKDGGKSCWSVKNFKTDKQYNLYDDIVTLHNEQGWEQMDLEFFVGNSVRPGSKNKNGQSKKSKEITYVFTKYIKV